MRIFPLTEEEINELLKDGLICEEVYKIMKG